MTKPRTRTRRPEEPASEAKPRSVRAVARGAARRRSATSRRAEARDRSTAALAAAPPVPGRHGSAALVAVLGEQLRALCCVVERVGDEGTDCDLVILHLAALASHPRRPARRGQERAWLLSALLHLLGASEASPDPRRLPLLRRSRASTGRIEVRPETLQRLQNALQGITRPERASVVLVVQEGLSLEQASRVLGHSRREFAEAYAEAIEALDDELLETLMGH